MTTRRWMAAVIAVMGLAATGCLAQSDPSEGGKKLASGDNVVVGVMQDMTGPIALYGKSIHNGAELAVGVEGLAEAVAVGLYKLMAYKDEYEVARLHLLAAERARITDEFGAGAKVRWHLHPPVLRALGMRRKIALGTWFAPAFRALRGMRRLRGTALDVFGYAKVRRIERRLVAEYRAMITGLLPGLNPSTAPVARELAALPDVVRGYEEIKLGNVRAYQERRAELLRRWQDVAAQAG